MAVMTRKPEVKKKRHRERARVAHATERVRRAEDDTSDDILIKSSNSTDPCGQGQPCGQDAACADGERPGTYYCVCPHDRQPPTKDLKCPNRNTVPLALIPIRNVIPPRPATPSDLPPTSQISMSSESVTETVRTGELGLGSLLAAGGGAFLLILLAVGFAALYGRRKTNCLHAGKTPQRVRPGEPLLAERYITNPQYGVWGATLGSATQPACAQPARAPRIDCTGLTFLEEVGEGCFGKVHKGLLRQGSSEQIVAIKVLKQSAGRCTEEDFLREVTIMSAFHHPNILALLGVVYREEAGVSPWMVFEYMEWGDLAGVLRGARHAAPPLNSHALLHVALQVARGMQYLASRRFIHRDLAARNCLVGSQLTVKIADFGMSRDVYTCDYYKMGGERPMPVRWMSPESIIYARFTLESDVWAFGVVLWEIYSRGKQPFYGHNNESATKLILQGIMLVPPEDCPRFACDLMRACWRSEPADRIKFEDICTKLETAGLNVEERVPLPRPPVNLDTEGYLVPASPPIPDYLAALPDPEPDSDSTEADDEYT